MSTPSAEKRAHDVMHPGAQCVGEHESVRSAARMMRDLSVGALPICGDDDRLKGIITDRDIVVKCDAEGKNLDQTTVGEMAAGLVWIDGEASIEETLVTMTEHQIKRVPVVENHRLVGMISEADLAKELPDEKLAEFVHRVYAGA
ncbi:CBS domain-containing protein [Sphaerisporangium siamense]|uniref:CBS domain-containing protein n=1 Tax=Sphaerisporangium siamense TaxID=795645 RepID=A0A7W7D8Z7_9ACTN|nr:CBS domain-containing protein [Sphaerisporangium siamense]MBB4702494.1 CBS domain-containing protein [Sphaerisporangium siamense]